MDWQALILWQDETLVAVNKPAGLLTLPDGYDPGLPHLRSVLEPHLGRLWIVHRLDRDTSGILLLARNAAAHRNLNLQFALRQVEKLYHAIVCGAPDWESLALDLPLRSNAGHRRRTVVDTGRGKPASTLLKVLERLKAPDLGLFGLVEARPLTGRTHQIRAHLAAVGYPIAGDPLYGIRMQLPEGLFQRTALHAWQVRAVHPSSGEAHTWQAPYPDDFRSALQILRQNSLL
jgi:tRNA pseudouridine32 synthase / 23S rRNA pseudouridine746 synthase